MTYRPPFGVSGVLSSADVNSVARVAVEAVEKIAGYLMTTPEREAQLANSIQSALLEIEDLRRQLTAHQAAHTADTQRTVHALAGARMTEAIDNRDRIEKLEALVTELYMWYQEQRARRDAEQG